MPTSAEASPFSVVLDAPVGEGVRFACKEMYAVEGHPPSAGHPGFALVCPIKGTSVAVALLVRQGARLIGKTHQSELAISGLGTNPHYTMPENAVDARLVPGGSSSGCAVAVARGLVDFSLTTDTAGSARIPAACNRVLGLSLAGAADALEGAVLLSSSLDQPGLLAAKPSVLWWAASVLLGRPLQARRSAGVVVPINLLRRAEPEVQQWFARTVEGLHKVGLAIYEEEWPEIEAFERLQREHGQLVLAEIAQSLKPILERLRPAPSAEIMELLAPYLGSVPVRLAQLHQGLKHLRSAINPTLPTLLPTLPCPVPQLQTPAPSLGSLTRFSNLLAHHSLSVPLLGGSLLVSGANLEDLMGIVDLVE